MEFAFKPIDSQDEYALYFNQLGGVFEKLSRAYALMADKLGSHRVEKEMIEYFLSRFLFTIKALRIKCTYDTQQELKVDLSESGFPSYFNVDSIHTDLNIKKDRAGALIRPEIIKQELLDHMMRTHEVSPALLQQVSESYYLSMIEHDKLFLSYTPGYLQKIKKSGEFRHYVCCWGCYDFSTNRPYINIMHFDQDVSAPALEEEADNHGELMSLVAAEGKRASKLGVIAVGIDMGIKDIHPKSLRRICIGPLCTRQFSKDPRDLHKILTQYGENDDDTVLMFEEEMLLSKGQTETKSLLAGKQTREIFTVPENEPECYERKVSILRKFILSPHTVAQHTDRNGVHRHYANHTFITHSANGDIHVS